MDFACLNLRNLRNLRSTAILHGRIRIHLGPDLTDHRPGHNQSAFGRGSRVLSAPKEPDRRSPYGSDRRDSPDSGLELVGDFFLESRDELDLREVSGPDCLDGVALHASIFLYPPDLSESEEHRDIWLHNRVGYYGAFVVMCLFDILQTGMRGGLLHPVWYLPYVGHYAVLSAVGLALRRRGYDRFFAWYQLVTILAWCLFFRRFLLQAGLT